MTDLDFRVQHDSTHGFVAVWLRDGAEWYLDGACVGLGTTPSAAIDELLGISAWLIRFGENFLSGGPIPEDARSWLAARLDRDDVERLLAAET